MKEQERGVFDYQKVTVEGDLCSQYIDSYQKFGWKMDENMPAEKNMGKSTLYMKRSRNILNKVELTRLQRHYEACMNEIRTLQHSKKTVPTLVSVICGLVGCVFMAGSVFAVTAKHPMIWMMVVLAIPGFLLWGSSYFVYQKVKKERSEKVASMIEAKYDEAFEACEKAAKIL